MKITNYLTITDAEFLADSIRCWQEGLAAWKLNMGNSAAESQFRYWAVHSFCVARMMTQ